MHAPENDAEAYPPRPFVASHSRGSSKTGAGPSTGDLTHGIRFKRHLQAPLPSYITHAQCPGMADGKSGNFGTKHSPPRRGGAARQLNRSWRAIEMDSWGVPQ